MRKIIIISSLMTMCIIVYAIHFWNVIEAIGCIRPGIAVHKLINHDQYNIIIFSKADFIQQIGFSRDLYADIWHDSKRINSFFITTFDVIDDYKYEIKDITVLSDTDELKVDFFYPRGFKNPSTTHTYKLSIIPKNSTTDYFSML
jgi:hypothetical protein